MRRLLALFAAAALCACSHQPRGAAGGDEPAVPAAWRTALGPQASLPRDWWALFGDPVLTRLVETALAQNLDVATAMARVREARAQEAQARSQQLPALDFALSAQRARTLGPFGTPTVTTQQQPVFQAAYELDLFGRIADQVEAARAGSEASEAAREAAALSVAAAAASGYITLRSLDSRLDILEATVVARRESVRVARERAEVGYTSDLEWRQAEAEYEATAQQVPQVRLAIERQEHALALLVGRPPGDVARGVPIARLAAPPIPAGLPSELLRRRPDIAQAERTLAAADATLAAARAQFLPQVRLTASLGQLLVSSVPDPVRVWSVGASVLAPIFNAGRIESLVDAADARREQSALAYRRTVLTAFREVEDNLSAVVRTREQRAHLLAQRAALADALRHASNRYRAGYSSYLEQLDAQRGVLSADLALAQVAADELNALVALSQAMGGGWSAPDR
jgi:NodT family efflux transporter outer membrane factor (OMF) lipoprotein